MQRKRFVAGIGASLCLVLFSLAPKAAEVQPVPNPPAAPLPGPYEAFVFVEVTPAKIREAVTTLKAYRDAARKEPDATLADIYEEKGTPSRFVAHEIWASYDAYAAHAKAQSLTDLSAGLTAIAFGPIYARSHSVYFTAGDAKTGAVIVVTHLDVGPASLPKLLPLLQPFADASAKDKGMQRFEILRQGPEQANHFRLWEIWDSEKDWQAHNMAAHTLDYRNALAPLLGTPYDQRLYTLVK